MDLLKDLPGSVLWLMKLNDSAEKNLYKEAIKNGVDPNRLIYATRLPKVEDHLARYRLADLFLDSFPYNGHTTSGDALFSGLPIVSICGGSFASRVTSSLLSDLGLNQYFFSTFYEYKNTASRLSKNPEELKLINIQINKQLSCKLWPKITSDQVSFFAKVLSELNYSS
jgi:predicted O-linked N-acetylglucosamine transferase (SPINDLY family)